LHQALDLFFNLVKSKLNALKTLQLFNFATTEHPILRHIVMLDCRKTFSTVRVPKPFMDEIVRYKDQTHIVIWCKGVYFRMEVFRADADGKEVQVTVPEIHAQLQRIVDMAQGGASLACVSRFL